MDDIHRRLRERRTEAGLTQGQTAEYEEVSKAYISNLESGDKTPKVWYLLSRLAKRYRTSADYILGLTDDPTPADVLREASALYLTDNTLRDIWDRLKALSEQHKLEVANFTSSLARIEEEQKALRARDVELLDSLLAALDEYVGEEETDAILEKLRGEFPWLRGDDSGGSGSVGDDTPSE